MGVVAGANINDNGLIFSLDAANFRSYSGSGLTSFGLVGGIGGTLVNGVGFTSSNNGSFTFDGTNDFIDCGNFLDNPTDFTVVAWQKTSASTNVQMMVAKLVNYGSGAGWGMFVRGDIPTQGLSFILQTNGSNWIVYYCSKLINDNNWHHCAAIITNKIVTGFYVDGISYSILNGSGGTISTISNSINVRIGRDEANEFIFNGNISNTAIYNRALTAKEIKQNYNATKKRYGL
jgi:hypothetical protein